MSDYAFVHQGKAYTPNGTDLAATAAADHNAELERNELAHWATRPDRMLAYYYYFEGFNGDVARELLAMPRTARSPWLTGAVVRTWPGTVLGRITYASIYRHNFGGRFVSIRVMGTNGAEYYGRASWDWGTCIWLRRVK